MRTRHLALAILLLTALSCTGGRKPAEAAIDGDPAYLEILDDSSFVLTSPYTGESDTVRVSGPMDNLVCMSSSYLGYLEAIGAADAVSAVSGIAYVSDTSLVGRYQRTLKGTEARPLYDVGYEAAPDYERIVSLQPDLLIAYSVSSARPPYLSRLAEMGVPVLMLYEHIENHPLARAAYVRLFGILTGRQAEADSAFEAVSSRYNALVRRDVEKTNVLINIPYGDQWYVPGAENYMSRLVNDAGGRVLGSVEGSAESGVISVEEALLLSEEADVWINTGWCKTRRDLLSANPAFELFDVPRIYNNTLRETPGGGNDFWESGAFRADLILEDLVAIMEDRPSPSFNYYIKVN